MCQVYHSRTLRYSRCKVATRRRTPRSVELEQGRQRRREREERGRQPGQGRQQQVGIARGGGARGRGRGGGSKGLTRVLSGKGVLARNFHALFKRLVEGLDRVHLLR